MKTPTCVIAEDEPLLRAELRDTLSSLWPELTILAEAGDGIAALRALQEHAPQLLFLDIEMPGMTGLEVAAQASRRCHVVFVTAYDKYALAAFEQGAVDYVLKPFSPARLASSIGRLKERLSSQPADLDGLLASLAQRDGGGKPHLRWIRASQGANVRLITVGEVYFFQADNKYTLVTTAAGESVIRTTIQELIHELDPELFWQVHRSTIVNVNEIASVQRRSNGTLELRLKRSATVLSVSTTYAHLFKQM
ncbi:MAG: LytTR family DNA-binding domain-containing protein [Pseudomonadota bacterium]|nr:LytTR family DNA-binding domain-containing protein [Pseudomonadota bacterium]